MQSLPQLRPTPGSLDSRRLEDRLGQMPTSLYLVDGRANTSFSAVVLEPQASVLHRQLSLEQQLALIQGGAPLWIRINGFGQPHRIATAASACSW